MFVPEIPFYNPSKISIFIVYQRKRFLFGQSFMTNRENRTTFSSPTPFIFLFTLPPLSHLSLTLSLSSFNLLLAISRSDKSMNMKGVAFDLSIRARFNHETLIQDYLHLQQDTEAARNRLEVMKQKKHTLEAEVRFLRRRYKFLMKVKSSAPQQVNLLNVETIQYRKGKKEKVNPKKVATLPKLPLIPYQFRRGKPYTTKKNIVPSQPLPVFDLDRNVNLHGNNSFTVTEINQKSAVVQARAPIFDLNQISVEEKELQESFEDQRKEQNDLKLSICRNVGDDSTNRSGKRKISWQDPVALRV